MYCYVKLRTCTAACCRYDASRTVDMRARANAAADAINGALAALDPGSSGKQMATAVADAALEAYDRVADREVRASLQQIEGYLHVAAEGLEHDLKADDTSRSLLPRHG